MPQELSNQIPKELLDLINNEETAVKIGEICFENAVKEEKEIKEIAYQVGMVLLGKLSPKEFPKILEEKTGFKTFSAMKIAREIDESIFFPVRESLATFYKKEIALSEKPLVRAGPEILPEEESRRSDVYREPIE